MVGAQQLLTAGDVANFKRRLAALLGEQLGLAAWNSAQHGVDLPASVVLAGDGENLHSGTQCAEIPDHVAKAA